MTFCAGGKHSGSNLSDLPKIFCPNASPLQAIAVAIEVRTFFNGPNDHVPVINIKALCPVPSAFCYAYSPSLVKYFYLTDSLALLIRGGM
jgi:hypothetical protein